MGLWRRLHGPDVAQVCCVCWILAGLFLRGLACPDSCTCNSTRISCEKIPGIVAFPVLKNMALAGNITDIYIAQQRNFASINENDAKIYTGLRNLTVVDSSLKFLSRQAFHKNPKLSYIDLSRNKLTSLNRKLFRHLSLTHLILGDNPFQCSCDIMWIKVFQKTNFLNMDKQNIFCRNEDNKMIPLTSMQIPNCALPTVNVSTLELTVLEGNSTTIYCEASGQPDPNVSWDISHIKSNSSTDTGKHGAFLTLKNVTSLDNTKTLVCTAENSVGEDQVFVELNVHFPPNITLIDIPTLDHHWCIPFSVRGNPTPKLQWFHEGNVLSETDFIWSKIHESSNNMSEHHGCLQLDNPTHLNNGLYTLRAENEYGKDERKMIAQFMDNPDIGGSITDSGFYDYETTSNDIGGTSTDNGNGVTSTDVSNEGNEDSITVYVVVGIAALVCTGLVIMLIILKFGRHSKFGLKVQKKSARTSPSACHKDDDEGEEPGPSSPIAQQHLTLSLVSSRPPSTLLQTPERHIPESPLLAVPEKEIQIHYQSAEDAAPESERTLNLHSTATPTKSSPPLLGMPLAQMSPLATSAPNQEQLFLATSASQQSTHLELLKKQVHHMAIQTRNTTRINRNVGCLTTELTRVGNTLEQMQSATNRLQDSFLHLMEDNQKIHQAYIQLLEANISTQQTMLRLMESQNCDTRDCNASDNVSVSEPGYS
ncbi:BDNF/NT-3 growth factors receptor isoform X4 [Pseudophryne corroboree]|uniref:BDNF/NT-3 growth factors receptor isoform X4 n=1 Tax=Pseudophryne corroboree TaxID=495146 RepID=UPI0030821C29